MLIAVCSGVATATVRQSALASRSTGDQRHSHLLCPARPLARHRPPAVHRPSRLRGPPALHGARLDIVGRPVDTRRS